mgnify:FL=1
MVVGDQEVEQATVNIRRYGSKETQVEALDIFVEAIEAEILNRSR